MPRELVDAGPKVSKYILFVNFENPVCRLADPEFQN